MNAMNKTILFLPTDGFRTLCEICWLDFGHKMADRNGTALATVEARSPQWFEDYGTFQK